MKILVTGTAGFIGYHLVKKLADRGDEITGIDNINDYYDVNLKFDRLEDTGISRDLIEYNVPVQSNKYTNYSFVKLALEDKGNLDRLFRENKFDCVCNLAAQAGVRYSLENPGAYIDSNICGFMNILESCRHNAIKHLVYASSSSVYGMNKKMPYSTSDNVDHPVSLYAATKKSNELMAHTYSHLFSIPSTGLRFFTVYGPWGRPDMSPFLFADAISKGSSINVYNYGDMKRDFTYINDIIEGVVRSIDSPPQALNNEEVKGAGSETTAPYRLYNIGNGTPVKLLDFISAIEDALGKKAEKNLLPMQPGDVYATWADTEDLERDLGYKPKTSLEEGVGRFVRWFGEYYGGEVRI